MLSSSILHGFLSIFVLFSAQLGSDGFQLHHFKNMTISAENAEKYCRSHGGGLANLANDSDYRKFAFTQLQEHCEPDFCPKICAFDSKNAQKSIISAGDQKSLNEPFTTSTQPIHQGDTMVLKLEMKANSIEVLQLSSNLPNFSQIIAIQLSIFSNYKDHFSSQILNGITVGYGKISKNSTGNQASKYLKTPVEFLNLTKPITGTIDLTLHFDTEGRVTISSPQIFDNETQEVPVEKISGRMYFSKFYSESRLLEAYFTRGNCSKTDFYHYTSSNNTFVNCLWTPLPKIAIPVISCRKASFVACENIPEKAENKTKKRKKQKQSAGKVKVQKQTENYRFSDFVEDYQYGFAAIFTISVALLSGAIYLQVLKLLEITRKDDGKKKRRTKRSKKSKASTTTNSGESKKK